MVFPTSCSENLLIEGSWLHGLGVPLDMSFIYPAWTQPSTQVERWDSSGAVPACGQYRRK